MMPIDQQAETIAAGFALERVFREGTRVRRAFDNALERQQGYVSYDVKAVSQYDIWDHVKDGKMLLATWEEAKEWKTLKPNFKVTPLKKNIQTPVVVLYNKEKFGAYFNLTRENLTEKIIHGNKMSLGATYGSSRSAVQRFLDTSDFKSRRPEYTHSLREKVQNVAEHPQIAFLGKNFATDALVHKDYDFAFAPADLAVNYYNTTGIDNTTGIATVNGKEYFYPDYELFQKITHIVYNGKNTKKVKGLRNALADKKLIRALGRRFFFVDPSS